MNSIENSNQPSPVEIRQNNAITTARYDYSACQLDIFFYLLSKLKKDDPEECDYVIYVPEIETLTGRKWNYKQLREATSDLGSRMFEVETDKIYRQIWIFQKVDYIIGKGYLEISLSNYIRPYLFDIKNNFTSYQLHSILNLSSKYAKRIYTICSQWKDLGKSKLFSIDELKYLLKIKDPLGKVPEQFKQISQFKQFVLDIAVRQINEKTELRIEYVIGKVGRASKTIQFKIIRVKPSTRSIPFEPEINDIKALDIRQTLHDVGIKNSVLVNTILRNDELRDRVHKFKYDIKVGKIQADKNAGGLLLSILGLITPKKSHKVKS